MKRFLCYLLLMVAAFFLQNNVFAASTLIMTVPNILLILVFSFGVIRGSVDGMLLGFGCGLLTDVFFAGVLGASALIYTVLGYLIGLLGRYYYTEFADMPLILCLISDLVYHLGVFVIMFLLRGQTHFWPYLTGVIVPELLYTAAVAIGLYPLLRRLNTLIEKWEVRKTKSFV